MNNTDNDANLKSHGSLPPDAVPEAEKPPKPEASRYKNLFLRILRWFLGFTVIFGLGLLFMLLVFYVPTRGRLIRANIDLEQAYQRIEGLESQLEDQQALETERQELSQNLSVAERAIDALEKRLSDLQPLEDENQDLEAQLEQANIHVALLSARIDVVVAQLALEKDDLTKATIALSKTSETLDTLAGLLVPEQRAIVSDMQERLDLVLSEIGDNEYAAQSDLDVLVNTLIELEVTFFAGP